MKLLTAICLLIAICFGMMVAQIFTTILAYMAAFGLVAAIILLFVKGLSHSNSNAPAK